MKLIRGKVDFEMRIKIWSLLFVAVLLIAGMTAQVANAEVDPNNPPESVYREGIENGLHPAEVRYQWRFDHGVDPSYTKLLLYYEKDLGLTPYLSNDQMLLAKYGTSAQTPELGDPSIDSAFLIAIAGFALGGAVYAHKKRMSMA